MFVIPLVQKIVGGAMLAAILVLGLMLFAADRRADKWEKRALHWQAELHRISAERDRQSETTGRNIAKGSEERQRAEKRAERIEAAPLVGQCKTPDAIMGADL